jgi:hypothetical protein
LAQLQALQPVLARVMRMVTQLVMQLASRQVPACSPLDPKRQGLLAEHPQRRLMRRLWARG